VEIVAVGGRYYGRSEKKPKMAPRWSGQQLSQIEPNIYTWG